MAQIPILALVLSFLALCNASNSFNSLLGVEVFPADLDTIQVKSMGDSTAIMGQLKEFLADSKMLADLYSTYKGLFNKDELRFDSNITMHQQIFAKNALEIVQHNLEFLDGKWTFEKGVNQFSDMTELEIENFLGYKVSLGDSLMESGLPKIDLSLSLEAGPDSLDWRKKKVVTPIKDQGQCGSCITFSVAGTLESAVAKSKGTMLDLSEQELLDCTFPENKGCAGGQFPPALRYIKSKGLVTEAEYPYKGTFMSFCKRSGKTAAAQASSFGSVDPKGSEDALKLMVAEYGPVANSVHSNQAFQQYKSGIFKASCTGQSNHALMIVGYGSENGQDFWIIKNSWGTTWGEKGFMRLARNAGNLCNVATDANYVVPQ